MTNKEKLILDLIKHSNGYDAIQILNYIHNWATTYNRDNNYNLSTKEEFSAVDEVVYNHLFLI